MEIGGDGSVAGSESCARDGRMRAVAVEVVCGAEGMDGRMGGGDDAE